jgi:UDP-N-acetylmuramate dehydrogenase
MLESQSADLRGEMRFNVPMSRYTTWRAGGQAERMYIPADREDLSKFLRTLPSDEKVFPLGLGSNLLVRDGGLKGTVLMMHGALTGLRLDTAEIVYAEAGVPSAKLARFAASHNLQGAEFLAGIPGTLGGMLAMNAGCYGSTIWDKVQRVWVVDQSGDIQERTPKDYEIAYRHVKRIQDSGFRIQDEGFVERGARSEERASKGREQGAGSDDLALSSEIFVAAELKFASGDGAIAKGEIKALLAKRNASQPLDLPNAGSVFRNPPNGFAARLIQDCGLKGKYIGGAQISDKHANFIVNTGDATAADIENLINLVRNTVLDMTGILLHQEVRIVGEAH